MYFVSATRLHLRSWLYFPFFMWGSWQANRQAERTPGFLAGQIWVDQNRTYWTLTIWEKEAAMRLMRDRNAHKRIMPRIQTWCDAAATTHWEQATPSLPSIVEVHQRITQQGHFTRLKRPSAQHRQQIIPAPVLQVVPLTLRPRRAASTPSPV